MTATLTELIRKSIEEGGAGALSTTLGLVLTALLIVMLILKEVVRIADTPRGNIRLRVFNIVVVPLLLAFGLIAIIRIVNLLTAG